MITDKYRVYEARKGGWVIKKAPGWSIVHRAENLSQCANWCAQNGIALTAVSVVTSEHISLAGHMEKLGDSH